MDPGTSLVGTLDVGLLRQAVHEVTAVAQHLEAGSPLRERLEASAVEVAAVLTEIEVELGEVITP